MNVDQRIVMPVRNPQFNYEEMYRELRRVTGGYIVAVAFDQDGEQIYIIILWRVMTWYKNNVKNTSAEIIRILEKYIGE